ncbi:MAG: hypothetical protein GEU28_10475 [Dehalococcoidia bacterium]|nr:hypothetical protein [Dehalococcoidia bacterium]
MIIKRPTVVINANPSSNGFLSVATFLPITRWRDVISSFRMSNRVEAQLKKSPGIVAYSLAVDPLPRHFWTYSIWEDRASMSAFNAAEPHATAVRRFADWAGAGAAFVEWDSAPGLDWSEAFERLKQPSFYYSGRP